MPSRAYDPSRDFLRVRDMLVDALPDFGSITNWRLERWNYARYFVSPMCGSFKVGSVSLENALAGIRFWEENIRVWEDGERVVGAAMLEYPWPGRVYLQRRPEHGGLLDEMLAWGEAHLADRKKGTIETFIYETDDELRAAAERRGFRKEPDRKDWDSEFVIDGLPESLMPEGYTFRSMADDNDIEKRREVFGRSFGHKEEPDWPAMWDYEELQKAPDYRRELDLSVIAPDGKSVACCIAWFDERNRVASLEPVGSIRLGYGREVVMEAVRRVAALGARSVWVGSGQRFYKVIGFERRFLAHVWVKEL